MPVLTFEGAVLCASNGRAGSLNHIGRAVHPMKRSASFRKNFGQVDIDYTVF